MSRPGPSALEHAERRLGALLRGKYRIEQILGVGGMATVYRAVHRNGNRVALKILRPELSVHDAHRERFVREAYVANSLDHPGAVRVLDDDVAEDGCPFLVMDLLVGETLEARYRRCGRLAAREVLALGHALCDVLARAHERGVVHRDIKPENIFLTTGGALKVLDFGIARVRQEGRGSGTQTGHLMGTPAYMPPEQALGRHLSIDGRTDLWAVGATMFTLLAARAVHAASTPEEAMIRSATQPAPALAELEPGLAPVIAALVDRALAFAQADRFPDARAMQAAIAAAHLEAFGLPLDATPLPAAPAPATLPGPPRSVSEADVTGIAADATDVTHAPEAPDGHAFTVVDPGTGSRSRASLPAASRSAASLPASPATASPRTHAASFPGPSPVAPTPPAPGPAAGDQPAPASTRSSRARSLGLGVAAAGLLAAAAALVLPGSSPAAGEPCTSNRACITAAGGAPAICRRDQGRCVTLVTERCRVLADPGDPDNDATVWIGAMYSVRDPSSSFGVEAMNLIELARRDFAGLTGGLPASAPGGAPRPIGVIACDDTEDHARTAAHLVDAVGVPAILGFGRSKEVLELAAQFFVPRGVLALASNTASMLSSIPHPPGSPRLVYRVTTSADMTSPPMAAFTRAALEQGLRGPDGTLGPAGTLRIAVLRNANASGISHTDALFTALARLRPDPGAAPELLRQFVADDRTEDPAALRSFAAEVVAFAPHIVLDAGAPGATLPHIERLWPPAAGPRPAYVFGGVEGEVLAQAAREQPDFHRRFHIVETRANTTTEKVAAHYLASFPGADARELSPSPYDAFYVLAYAAIALGDEPVTGRALARAIGRLLPPGEPVELGPAGIYPALKVLARGGNIDLHGTLTTLDFDLETGDATADFVVVCLDPTGTRRIDSGITYDASTGQLIGSGRCP